MRKRRLFSSALGPLVLGLGLGSSGAAFAQQLPIAAEMATEVEAVIVTGARDDGYSAERTATATRTNTPLRDVPQAITVVTEEVIRDQAMSSMADVLRYVPGAGFAQGEGNRDAAILRGQASTADFFVDGVRDDVQYFRDLYNAERIEVLKGPNAMIFGRGGGGGVINRVTKKADFKSAGELRLEGGSFDLGRVAGAGARAWGEGASSRLVAVYENSGSYRDGVELERWGINPSVAWRSDDLTAVLSYERFSDWRTADRGVPSYQGRPSPSPSNRFFGDPDISHADADVNLVNANVEWRPSEMLVVRNHTLFGDYDKFYQNVFAGGAATGTGPIPTSVPLQAYNNRNDRQNLFNQTDLVWQTHRGGADHTVLAGVELGRQVSENLRNTGFFDNVATTRVVPFAAPTITGVPVTFRQSATDADSHVRATVGAVYLQDQAEITEHLQLIGGIRFDRFELDFRNNRNGQSFSRSEDLVSPRFGIVIKPIEPLSLYGSYSVSYLPSSGDQFSSLTSTTVTQEPEKFTNREVGVKWALARGLALTAAAYQLDRDNTSAPDPDHPGFVVQTGAQRARGVELGVSGKVSSTWQVIGGYGWQEVEITSTTSAAPAGRKLPLTPAHTASLWNKWTLSDRWAVGLGASYRSKSFAAIDNAVVLPGFTRLDGAVFLRVSDKVSAQLNVENLLDEDYFATSQGNNNIAPGAPRTVRMSLQTRF